MAERDDVKPPSTMKSSNCVVEHYSGIDTPKKVNEIVNENSLRMGIAGFKHDEGEKEGVNRIMK